MINIPFQGPYVSVILRLRQASKLINPYYLFQLTNKNSKVETYITADDISLNVGLYQEFMLQNGVVGLTQGQWDGDSGEYLVLIMDTQYPYDINPASASSVLAYDIMRVYGATASPTMVSFTDNDKMTFKYYGQ